MSDCREYLRGRNRKHVDINSANNYVRTTQTSTGHWVIIIPLLVAGTIGVILGSAWGYALWTTIGVFSIYINTVLWFSEKEYVYPKCGPLMYYTFFWGFYVYWGIAVTIYSLLRLQGLP